MLICDNCKSSNAVKYVSIMMEILGDDEQEIVYDYALNLCGDCQMRQKAALKTAKITTLSGRKSASGRGANAT